MRSRLARICCVLLLTVTASCALGGSEHVALSVVMDDELADIQPLLKEIEDATGVELRPVYRPYTEIFPDPKTGWHQDLAWLASDRYFRLKTTGERPLSTATMLSPVVVGLKHSAAERLRHASGTDTLSWADLADGAAAGLVRFGMADPAKGASGLVALVGVATAASGRGAALRPQDVTCDRLRGLFAGQTLAADSTAKLADAYVGVQEETDGLIGYESALLRLNAGGKLKEPLELIYPRDGIVLSDFPLLLLDPAKRTSYDKVVTWLKSTTGQKAIMSKALRRALDPHLDRDGQLSKPVGNALYFPDDPKVIDTLLANYDGPGDRPHDRVFFLVDYSRSMEGTRIAKVKSAFEGLGGKDLSTAGKFVRFHVGEEVTVVRFGGRVLGERTFKVGDDGSLDGMRDYIAGGAFDESTAIWSALDHTYEEASGLLKQDAQRRVSIVVMTDGQNNAGLDAAAFLRRDRPGTVHTYGIRFGEADGAELNRVTGSTGGRMVDATGRSSLLDAFKEIRGCR